jgi:hypothetical protein
VDYSLGLLLTGEIRMQIFGVLRQEFSSREENVMGRVTTILATVAAIVLILASAGICASSLSNIVMTPGSPASLVFSEHVEYSLDYETDEAEGVYIFVLPYTGGSPTPHWMVSGSVLRPEGTGSQSGYFTITADEATVDQVRIWMMDADQIDTLAEAIAFVEYSFSSNSITNIELSPATPAELEFNDHVDIAFDYATDEASGVQIFARPFSTVNSVAIIYDSDSSWANDFAVLLSDNGHTTTLIEMAEVSSASFALYDLILVDSRTSTTAEWGDSASVAKIQDSGKPVLGLGFGGTGLFEEMGLSINWSNAWTDIDSTSTSIASTYIHAVDPSSTLFSTPNVISVPSDSNIRIYDHSGHKGEYAPSLADSVVLLGREPTDANHYSLVNEGEKYWLWAFTASPGSMTQAGKDLFINFVAAIIGTGGATPNYAASGSPDYSTGSGSGTAYFTITSGEVTVNYIRFQMFSVSPSALLLEFFIPVSYDFASPSAADSPISDPTTPSSCILYQNYPNPFNPSTAIRYKMLKQGHVTISVYNTLGQDVATIVNEMKPVGTHTEFWNGTDAEGNSVPSGVYFYRIVTDDFVDARKMVLLK